MSDTVNRLSGTLLGTALGDALGLPVEGMSPRMIARRFGRMDRFRLLGRTGFVSDDTEQPALVAQSLARAPQDASRAADLFRRALIGWFLRLQWGIGLATLRACMRGLFGCARRACALPETRFGDRPLAALSETISAGGDTDSIAAIVGAWVGALHGASGLPPEPR